MGRLLVFVCLIIPALQAIEVANKSQFELYGAPYYFRKEAEREGEIELIKPSEKQSFKRPKLQGLKKRKFVFSMNIDDLKPKMSSSEYHLLPHMPIGAGNKFYLDLDKGSFKGYNRAQWKVFEPIKRKLKGVMAKFDDATLGMIRRKSLSKIPKALRNIKATVRRSTDIYEREKSFLARRNPKVQVAVSKLVGKKVPISKVPTIAIAGSGGGYRAMLGFLGFLLGAQESGLLDATKYISALSGSTWALNWSILSILIL